MGNLIAGMKLKLWHVAATVAAVYILANFNALTGSYVVNDDVRQQIYWMDRWNDPELFQSDYLTEYAETYVPSGIKVLYWTASFFVTPLAFTNILAGILFVITACLIFLFARRCGDEKLAVLTVCVYVLFGSFLERMAGGLSRGFVFPLLMAYLLYLSQGEVRKASWIILLQSFLNPYLFLLCFSTHALFLIHRFGPHFLPETLSFLNRFFPRNQEAETQNGFQDLDRKSERPEVITTIRESESHSIKTIFLNVWPAGAALLLICAQLLAYGSSTGFLVSRADMIGKSEYSTMGRFQLDPLPSFFHELYRPWMFNLSFIEWGPVAGWIGAVIVSVIFIAALVRWRSVVKWSGFYVFIYLVPASIILYFAADLVLMKLFLPRRYVFYTLSILYCLATAVCLRILIDEIGLSGRNFALGIAILLIFAPIKMHNVGLDDYSGDADLYRFIETTPKDSLITGHPDVMDNIPTFAKRKVFINQELSHPWVEPYWSNIKKRTFDFFSAYYSSNADAVRRFGKDNSIDYLIVRNDDFSMPKLSDKPKYFEPFNGYIWYLLNSSTKFAVMDETEFPSVFKWERYRVIRLR
jgi:hypothetical protein